MAVTNTKPICSPVFLHMYFIFLLALLCLSISMPTQANGCRLEDQVSVDVLKQHLEGVEMLVSVCPHCSNQEPVPLRVNEYGLVHTAPDMVQLVFYDLSFPVSDLEQAEKDGNGPLAEALRAAIEEEYTDETGYLPDDPYLIKEKRERFAMMLGIARGDLEIRTWDELEINGEPVNPALLYYPVGGNRYQSLGAVVGCELYGDAPLEVTFTPVNRDPALEAPPDIYIADITNQCYDGSCPLDKWIVVTETEYFDGPEGNRLGEIPVDEVLKPVQTLSYVRGGRATAMEDHGRIFSGDVFYLLDSLAEGFYRFWHYGEVFIDDSSDIKRPKGWNYCEKNNSCWAELETFPESTWWSKVSRSNGEAVWVKEPINSIRGVLED